MTTYYIDNTRGNDASDGLSKDTAWKSLENLTRGFGGSENVFLLESDSIWDYSTSDFSTIKGDIYNSGMNSGLNYTGGNAAVKTKISNYYYGNTTSNLPTITKNYKLLSNAQCKFLWKYDSTWQAWYINYYDFVATVSSTTASSLVFNTVTDAPHAGCLCTLSTTGALPNGIYNNTISDYSWANGIGTFTTSSAHTIVAGEEITVSGVSQHMINGTFTVLGGANSPTSTTFKVSQALNPGVRTSGGVISYYAYPVSATEVKLYSNYSDALAGNNNHKAIAGGSGTHTINFTPKGRLGNNIQMDWMYLFNGEWGESFSQEGMTAPLPQQNGAYSTGYGTYKNYIYAPSNIDPGAYYTEILMLPSSTAVFKSWNQSGVLFENIKFLKSCIGVLYFGDNLTQYANEVRNCVSEKSAPLVSLSTQPTSANTGFKGNFYNNACYNAGYASFISYNPNGKNGDTQVAKSIVEVNIHDNYVNGCNQSFSAGGAMYISSNAGLDGIFEVYNNHILNACHAKGNAHYDGAALYAELYCYNIVFRNNLIENCPVPLEDNSGGKVQWIGNIMVDCGMTLPITDEGFMLARNLSFYNNTIYNARQLTTFPSSLLGNQSFYKTTYSGANAVALHSWRPGFEGACTFSGILVTTADRTAGTLLPIRFTTTGALPSPLQLNTDYYPRRISNTTFKVFLTESDASNNVNPISFSGGTGTHTGTQKQIINIKNNIFHAAFSEGKVTSLYSGSVITLNQASNLFYGYTRQSNGTLVSNEYSRADSKLNAQNVPLSTSPAVRSGTKWWNGSAPVDINEKVYSETNINIGAVQSFRYLTRTLLGRAMTWDEIDANFSAFGGNPTLRANLTRPLTWVELDANFQGIGAPNLRSNLNRPLTWAELDANFQ